MRKSKFGKFVLLGALVGGAVSMFDYTTRRQVIAKSKCAVDHVNYYVKNPDVLKEKVKSETEKYQSLYGTFSEEATYFKEKMDELKGFTPQVKELAVDTKEAFEEVKEEYKTMKNEDVTEDEPGK